MKEHSTHVYNSVWNCEDYQIIDCQTCGYKHIFPIPTSEGLEIFYREKYHRDVKPFCYDKVTPEYIERVKEQIKNNITYQEIYLKINSLKKTRLCNMIDVGCGNDLLLKYFQLQGWDVQAIEPSSDADGFLQKFGIKVYGEPVERIDSLNLKEIAFTNIQYVLEHLREPLNTLQKINSVMAPGGVIRISVPNDFNEGQLAYVEHFQEHFHWVCLPDHINYFSFDSLSQLLTKAGFKELYRTTNFPLEFLLMAGINYYGATEEKAKVGPIVANFEGSMKKTGRSELLKQLYEHLAQLGFGRSIFMYAIKEYSR